MFDEGQSRWVNNIVCYDTPTKSQNIVCHFKDVNTPVAFRITICKGENVFFILGGIFQCIG